MKQLKDAHCCDTKAPEHDLRPVEGKKADEELALMTKALGHPARIQILRLLARRQSCICGEIVDQIEDLAQSTVSQHLKVLKGAGLIKGETEGTAVCYCVEPRGLRRLKVLVAGI
ncbi:metalloregulator ArsR/SmtB family transcription factor [Bdellovibrionota bacterium FG-1]